MFVKVLQCLKEFKEKKRKNEKEKSMVKHKEVGNIEKNSFCGFSYF